MAISASNERGIGGGVGSASQGLVVVKSNEQIIEEERIRQAAEKKAVTPEVVTLASFIRETFETNRTHRYNSGVEDQMLTNLRNRSNKYDQNKLALINEQGGTDIFMGVIGLKCRAAEAWIADIMAHAQDKPFELKPSSDPEMNPEIESQVLERTMQEFIGKIDRGEPSMTESQIFQYSGMLKDQYMEALKDEAEDRARRHTKKIKDDLEGAKWSRVLDDFICDMVTNKAGIIKGPIIRKRRKLGFQKNSFGKTVHVVTEEYQKEFERVSPFDIYPSPEATEVNEGNLVERIRFHRKSLSDMIGQEGYDDTALESVLLEHGKGYLQEWTYIDQERAELENKADLHLRGKDLIEGYEFWGSVQGKLLIDRGMTRDLDGNTLDALREYEINAILVGRHIIYSEFNPDPLGGRPYSKCGYAKEPGSWWYKGVPELMEDLQQICNAAVRSLVNNMGIASGPQVVIEDLNRLPHGEDITKLYAWKIWQFVNKSNSTLPAISFFQPDSRAGELMSVYDSFASLADDYTGIPAYSYGNDQVAGAGRTASGLNMLMNSAARGIKKVIARIDIEVINDIVEKLYYWNMIYDPDESIKGDMVIVPIGIMAILLREQLTARRMEFANLTNNPVDLQIMGINRRANVLRSLAENLEYTDNEVVPSKDEMDTKARQMESQPGMNPLVPATQQGTQPRSQP